MSTISDKFLFLGGIFKRMMLSSLFCFASLAQAQTAPPDPFDHAKTGFLLRDIHTTLKCEQCHVDGVFKGTPKECVGCHTIGSRVAATPRPVNHVVTTQSCDTCHVSPTSFLVASFKHVGITSGCTSCHNGQSLRVVSKPANHFPTLLPCESCHTNTATFTSARMDHTGITTGCASCHGGQFVGVVSKPVAHIATTAPCEVCHSSTVTFLGAVFAHDPVAVASNCLSCHGGPMPGIKGMPVNHLPTAGAQCDVCHTQANTGNFITFLGALYHNATTNLTVANQCSTCHNGSVAGAYSKPVIHVVTTAQCDTCHTAVTTVNYTTWLGAFFNHAGVAGGVAGKCSTCHNGSTALGKPVNHIPSTPANAECDTCHTSVNTNNYTTFLGATYSHPGVVAGICSNCHGGTYPGVKAKSANHMVTAAQCDTCHTLANTNNYTTFLGAGVAHTAAMAGTCQTCHNGAGSGKGPSVGHIPVGSISCDGCHAMYNGTTVTTFFPGTMNHALVTAQGCSVCHGGAYTTQGVKFGGAQAKVINHIPTTITSGLECTTCHTLPNYTSATGWLQEKMNHNGAQGGGPVYCVNCHLSGVTYLGTMQKKSHNGASVAKDCSSAGCHRPKGTKGVTYSTWN